VPKLINAWTELEKITFVKSLKLYGRDHIKIAEAVQTKSVKQCSARALIILSKLKKVNYDAELFNVFKKDASDKQRFSKHVYVNNADGSARYGDDGKRKKRRKTKEELKL
jgi:hypothetical protein